MTVVDLLCDGFLLEFIRRDWSMELHLTEYCVNILT